MKKWISLAAAVVAGAMLLAGASGPVIPASRQPRYNADGSMLRPADYREWVYLSTGLGMNYAAGGPNGTQPFQPAFTNVFVQPEAYKYFLANGRWPDKTIFALEIYSSTTHGSINKSGHFQDSFEALEANVKDSSRPDGWAFYNFGTDSATAKALPKQACLACHEKNGAVENTFVQFYPQLLDVAVAKGTLRPGYEPPLNASRLYTVISQKGWTAAQQALQAEKLKDPDTKIDSEASLNTLGYRLISAKKPQEAIAVLKYLTEQNPKSVNALDSLADAYAAAGDTTLELQTAKRELELARTSDLPEAQRAQFIKLATDRIAKLEK